jgi:hypothetical protein
MTLLVILSPWRPKVSRLTRMRRAAYPIVMPIITVLFLALLGLQMLAPALAQGGPLPSATVELMPILMTAAQIAAVLVLTLAGWFVYKHVKDQNARDAILNVFEKAVGFGINVVSEASKDRTMSVNVGSSVVANGLRYALAQAPDALKRFGFDEVGIARALWARLPNVQGEVNDQTFNSIVAAATGKNAPTSLGQVAGSVDMGVLVTALLDEVARRKSSPGAAAAQPAPTPAPAPAPAPSVSTAAPPPPPPA